jgi:type II secretory pathway component PulF
MPEFAYVARDLSGQKKSGTITANSQHEVLTQLDSLALMPVEITASKTRRAEFAASGSVAR